MRTIAIGLAVTAMIGVTTASCTREPGESDHATDRQAGEIRLPIVDFGEPDVSGSEPDRVVVDLYHLPPTRLQCDEFAGGAPCEVLEHYRVRVRGLEWSMRDAAARIEETDRPPRAGADTRPTTPGARLLVRADERCPWGLVQQMLCVRWSSGRLALAAMARAGGSPVAMAIYPARSDWSSQMTVLVTLDRTGGSTRLRRVYGATELALGVAGDEELHRLLMADHLREGNAALPLAVDASSKVPLREFVHQIDIGRGAGITAPAAFWPPQKYRK